MEKEGEGEEEKDRLKDSSLKEESTSGERQKGGFWKTISLMIQDFFEKIRGKSNEDETFPSKLTINAYFCSLGEDSKLVGEKRTIIAGEVNTAVLNAMNELLKGPVKSYHFPVIPAGTKILGVEVYENVAKLNLSQEFLENSLDTRILDEYIIYSIVNTLTEIPGVDGVIFYIDEKKINVYGNLDLSVPIIRNEELIGK
ncbi:MAG: GerMN domain-containing protein [Actinobacteria bacterium]|nr:GerMN domain-containing protein [Actinomycetota bacterium]